MSRIKEYLMDVSYKMGKDGDIDKEVIDKATTLMAEENDRHHDSERDAECEHPEE